MSKEITATLKFSTGMHCDAALISIKSNSEQMVSDDIYDCGVYDWIAYNLEVEIPKCSILTIKVSVSPSFWGGDIDEINYEIIGDVVIEDANHDRLTEENAELREMLKRNKKAFLNQVELDLIKDSAKQETKELAESIHKLLNK